MCNDCKMEQLVVRFHSILSFALKGERVFVHVSSYGHHSIPLTFSSFQFSHNFFRYYICEQTCDCFCFLYKFVFIVLVLVSFEMVVFVFRGPVFRGCISLKAYSRVCETLLIIACCD